MTDVVAALRRRVRRDGARPLLTWYDLGRGERTELSAVSYANWVDKASHLLDGLGVAPGDRLGVGVAAERPGHWVGLVAVMAGWRLGAAVRLAAEPGGVQVVGGDHPFVTAPPPRTTVVACSLHPLGLPLRPPAPVVDFADVLAQPDVPLELPHAGGAEALDGLTYADLAAVAPEPRRVLVEVGDPHRAVLDGLVAPLLGGGSAVLVAGEGAPGERARVAAAERAEPPAREV